MIIREDSSTNENHGTYPGKRTIEQLLNYGVINLNKPQGPTSHQTVAWIRDMLALNKVAHTGTIDPMVSGVLVVMLNESVKATELIGHEEKEYVALMHVHKQLPKETIEKSVSKFVGKIKQIPPLKSAVARRERVREIMDIKLPEINGKDVLLKVRCEAGTYIRRLVDDIGKDLKCGAHMAELRRTRAGIFRESGSFTMHELKDAWEIYKETGDEKTLRQIIRPLEEILQTLKIKRLIVKDSAVNKICNGAAVGVNGIAQFDENIMKGEKVVILTLKGEVIAAATALMNSSEIKKAERGLAAKTDRVLMRLNTYPYYVN
ncbi:MAG: RNA-guided pseudouridylation complex pseudouridine synthase subunit Cbf5 [Candidatus Aenigmarchaeota archaeon]|nr:RNA-guided pseudouridylation complex pseudouridine synthase subunit Cbf5 [Candidatus Aenigmarchaeota archaeon]